MDSVSTIGLLILGIVLAIILVRETSRRRVSQKRSTLSPDYEASYDAVVVCFPSPHAACTAFRTIMRKRYLVTEAPKLPLRDCNNGRCQCYYQYFKDRRDKQRRLAKLAIGFMGKLDRERRAMGDRRRRVQRLLDR